MNVPVWLLAIVGSGPNWIIVVVSLVLSFAVLISPPPDTAALLVSTPAALLATFTVTVMSGYAFLEARTSLRVQVRVGRSHDHPVPAMALAVSPEGSVSTTLTGALVSIPPALVTVRE